METAILHAWEPVQWKIGETDIVTVVVQLVSVGCDEHGKGEHLGPEYSGKTTATGQG